ncbi:hypothetical protein FPZ54_09490 [Sphingomonas suaedae]|uniref:Uncharacterized protein n=1 Tax=Sphingomonas suaedae TaxID=2599297 RepID=A0A518RFK0_9SPHN|nr:hypothetical protein [Sphingomonas suaedae]QDX26230.1 hypothetical protein FPZ54_09490 [Sphingomonas suaedae]
MHPLLRHEWAVLRGEVALALPGWRDWLMLAVMVALALALLTGSEAATALRDNRVAALVGAVAGWAGVRAGRRRLDHLARESVIAWAAIDSAGRRFYWAAALFGVALVLAGLGTLAGAPVFPAMFAGMAAGALAAASLPLRTRLARAAAVPPPRDLRRMTPADAVSGYQVFACHPHGRIVAPLVAALASVALAIALPSHWNPALRLAIPAGSVALAMLALIRVDAEMVVFLARSGHGAWRSAGLHLRAAASYAAILLPLLLLCAPHAFWSSAGVIVAIAIVTTLRVWSFRAYPKRFADMMLLFGGAGGAVLGASFPPLLVPFVAIAGIVLLRRAARATWIMA